MLTKIPFTTNLCKDKSKTEDFTYMDGMRCDYRIVFTWGLE